MFHSAIFSRIARCNMHAHSNHEWQLAKIMAEVGSSTSSPRVSLHEWLDKDSKVGKESLNDEERINGTKTR